MSQKPTAFLQHHDETGTGMNVSSRLLNRLTAAAVVTALTSLAGVMISVLVWDPAEEHAPLIGRQAPGFSLDRIGGPGNVTTARFAGHPMIINFWASWCDVCRSEFVLLDGALERHREKGLVVLGVLAHDIKERGYDFLRQTGVDWLNGVDVDAKTTMAYGVRGLPQTVFVAPDGHVSAVHFGELDDTALERYIEEMAGTGE
ncbi:TlpA family protein disulfide reductase [Nonomuraea spiralis]|uniref:TlpA family protein disulfide reductase n=1 Tax=Nonomuraea spiralis TaxID=46182 RepID=UPI003788BB5F